AWTCSRERGMTMPQKLSERQVKMLDFIEEFLRDNGYPPTIREIGKAVRISSTSVVKYNLEKLESLGHLHRKKEAARGLRLSGGRFASAANVIGVPLLGYIQASEPLPAYDPFSDEMVELTLDIVKEPQLVYALRVQGESMRDASVHDGDLVILRQQQSADTGEMVAAWLGEERGLTLKRYYPEGKLVRLQPANDAYEPIMVPANQIKIQGKVIAVVRRLD
ncbi:MAG TPA: transcriptional repressor LexA, partial [Anaerolineae bacterium]|nr:transcriptional repressor LexA [Anaerolineae bacterium]